MIYTFVVWYSSLRAANARMNDIKIKYYKQKFEKLLLYDLLLMMYTYFDADYKLENSVFWVSMIKITKTCFDILCKHLENSDIESDYVNSKTEIRP